MFGIAILLVIGGYFLISVFVVYFVDGVGAKILFTALFILIPVWDIVPKQLHTEHMCESGNVINIKSEPDTNGFVRTRSNYEFKKLSQILSEREVLTEDKLEKAKSNLMYSAFNDRENFDLFFNHGVFVANRYVVKGNNRYIKVWISEASDPQCTFPLEREDYRFFCSDLDCAIENKCLAITVLGRAPSDYFLETHSIDHSPWTREYYVSMRDRQKDEVVAEGKYHLLSYPSWVLAPFSIRQTCPNEHPNDLEWQFLNTFFAQ